MLGRRSELEIAAREAEKERDAALKKLVVSRDKLLSTRKRAEDVVDESMLLLNSVSSVPLVFRKDMGLIRRERKRFKRSDEIVKSQFARETAVLGAAAIAAGGFAGVVWKMRSKLTELLKSNKLFMVAGSCSVFLIIWKVRSLFVRKNAEEWRSHADGCIEEARIARNLGCQADADERLISSHLALLGDLLTSVEGARGKKFRSLSSGLQDSITQLLSNTQWLAKLLNGEVIS